MADKWPAATGNWSTAANWNGGTLPQPGDDVYADGKTVTIDQDINVASIRTTQRSGGTAGGGFTIPAATGTRNLVSNIIAGTTTCVLSTGTGTTGPITITGDISSGSGGIIGFGFTGGILIVNGNISGGTGGNSCIGVSLNNTSAVTTSITVNGNIQGAVSNVGPGLRAAGSPSTITINGNLTYTTSPAVNITSTGIQVTVNGQFIEGTTGGCLTGNGNFIVNPIGGTISTKYAISCSGGGSCVINGNLDAGTSTGQIVSVDNNGYVTVNGNVTGGTVAGGIGILVTQGIVLVNGTVTGKLEPGISVIATSTINRAVVVSGEVIGSTTTAMGYGISNLGNNSVYVFGNITDNLAPAVFQGSTGTTTVVETVQEITMACVELLNVTEDDISSVQEITGTFDFQANSPEGGTYYLYRALGASVDSEKRDDFQLYKQFNGPANLPIDNTGTNRFKVQLQGTKGVADKVVTVNIQD